MLHALLPTCLLLCREGCDGGGAARPQDPAERRVRSNPPWLLCHHGTLWQRQGETQAHHLTHVLSCSFFGSKHGCLNAVPAGGAGAVFSLGWPWRFGPQQKPCLSGGASLSAHCHNLSSVFAAAAAAAVQTTLLNTLACRLDRDTRVRLACNLGKGAPTFLAFAALLV